LLLDQAKLERTNLQSLIQNLQQKLYEKASSKNYEGLATTALEREIVSLN